MYEHHPSHVHRLPVFYAAVPSLTRAQTASLLRCCTVQKVLLLFSLYDFPVRDYVSPITSYPDSRPVTKIRHEHWYTGARWVSRWANTPAHWYTGTTPKHRHTSGNK